MNILAMHNILFLYMSQDDIKISKVLFAFLRQ